VLNGWLASDSGPERQTACSVQPDNYRVPSYSYLWPLFYKESLPDGTEKIPSAQAGKYSLIKSKNQPGHQPAD
jgi:hypothetical protein